MKALIESAVGILHNVLFQPLASGNIWLLKRRFDMLLSGAGLLLCAGVRLSCLMRTEHLVGAGITHTRNLILFQQTLALAESRGTHLG